MSNTNKKRKLSKAEQEHRQKVLGDLGLAAKTLINNDACIKVSREWTGFKGHGVPIIIAIISILLALIPSLVTRLNVNAGNTFLGSPNYSYDVGISEFTKAMHEKSVHVKVVDGTLVTEGDWNTVADHTEATSKMYWYQASTTAFEEATVVFEAFLNNDPNLTDSDFFANIAGDKDASKTPDGAWRSTKIGWSYIAFGKNSMAFASYKPGNKAIYSYINGRYDRLNGYDFIFNGYPEADVVGYKFLEAMRSKWSWTINQSYETTKIASTFQYVGILAGVYAGLLVLFGFLIWIMTRGKNNPLRVFKIWETQRMSYWASFTPAVLSIIAGFILQTSSLGMFAFIFLFGMRLMWMSMKALRPVQ